MDRRSTYETVDRIRRSHRSAKPNPAENPAWANCHMDCGVLLAEIDRLSRAYEVDTGEWRRQRDLLQGALETLLPGLVLDLRYADLDDDKDAMQSRIETVTEALQGLSAVSATLTTTGE